MAVPEVVLRVPAQEAVLPAPVLAAVLREAVVPVEVWSFEELRQVRTLKGVTLPRRWPVGKPLPELKAGRTVTTAAEIAAPGKRASPSGGAARKPARRPLPAHLPRERIVYPAPCSCPECGGPVRKLGEDVTETLECEPRRWKVVEHVREKVSCRCCEAISQPPAPSHPIVRGRAGPNLLALVLAAKYGQHLPLTRQSAIYAREGVELDVSTLADWVGSSAAVLMPLVLEVRTHVFVAERLHGD